MTKLVKSVVSQSPLKLNIANMFFYFKSKQKAKPQNSVILITMLLEFCSQNATERYLMGESKGPRLSSLLKNLKVAFTISI